jgi:hypothetical protein
MRTTWPSSSPRFAPTLGDSRRLQFIAVLLTRLARTSQLLCQRRRVARSRNPTRRPCSSSSPHRSSRSPPAFATPFMREGAHGHSAAQDGGLLCETCSFYSCRAVADPPTSRHRPLRPSSRPSFARLRRTRDASRPTTSRYESRFSTEEVAQRRSSTCRPDFPPTRAKPPSPRSTKHPTLPRPWLSRRHPHIATPLFSNDSSSLPLSPWSR